MSPPEPVWSRFIQIAAKDCRSGWKVCRRGGLKSWCLLMLDSGSWRHCITSPASEMKRVWFPLRDRDQNVTHCDPSKYLLHHAPNRSSISPRLLPRNCWTKSDRKGLRLHLQALMKHPTHRPGGSFLDLGVAWRSLDQPTMRLRYEDVSIFPVCRSATLQVF